MITNYSLPAHILIGCFPASFSLLKIHPLVYMTILFPEQLLLKIWSKAFRFFFPAEKKLSFY